MIETGQLEEQRGAGPVAGSIRTATRAPSPSPCSQNTTASSGVSPASPPWTYREASSTTGSQRRRKHEGDVVDVGKAVRR